MPVVDPESISAYIRALDSPYEREELFRKYLAMPYQVVNDSPTIKHYTEWSNFEKLNLNLRERKSSINTPIAEGYETYQVVNNVLLRGEVRDGIKCGIVRPEDHKLAALVLSSSRVISIRSGGKFFIYNSCEEGLFCPMAVEVKVPEGETADVVYYSRSIGRAMTGGVISLEVPKGSSLSFSMIGDGRNSFDYTFAKGRVEGEISSSLFSAGYSTGHMEYRVELEEEAIAKFSAKALGLDNNNVSLLANVNHAGKRSSSNGILKAVASGSSYTVIRGDAVIGENALDASTTIIGKALIVGEEAKAVVAPMLEVKTGKIITAKHSASASKVNDDLIFYLQSRGFDRRSAEGLIIRGFLTDEGDNELIRKLVEAAIAGMGY
jgi:ABC-type transport system involved in Fe-S cluster assembly, permease component